MISLFLLLFLLFLSLCRLSLCAILLKFLPHSVIRLIHVSPLLVLSLQTLLETMEEEVSVFFETQPVNSIYQSCLPSGFQRLLLHATAQYLNLVCKSELNPCYLKDSCVLYFYFSELPEFNCLLFPLCPHLLVIFVSPLTLQVSIATAIASHMFSTREMPSSVRPSNCQNIWNHRAPMSFLVHDSVGEMVPSPVTTLLILFLDDLSTRQRDDLTH